MIARKYRNQPFLIMLVLLFTVALATDCAGAGRINSFRDPDIKDAEKLLYRVSDGEKSYKSTDLITSENWNNGRIYILHRSNDLTSTTQEIWLNAMDMSRLFYQVKKNGEVIYLEDVRGEKAIFRGISDNGVPFDRHEDKRGELIYSSSSLNFSMRGIPISRPGDTMYFKVLANSSIYEMYATIEGIEIIKVPAGQFKCYKVGWGPTGFGSAFVKYYTWISVEKPYYMVKYAGHNGMPWDALMTIELSDVEILKLSGSVKSN